MFLLQMVMAIFNKAMRMLSFLLKLFVFQYLVIKVEQLLLKRRNQKNLFQIQDAGMTIVFKGSTGWPREDMKYTSQHPVSFAAVIRVITQRFSSTSGGEALHDDPNNGCEGDYTTLPF